MASVTALSPWRLLSSWATLQPDPEPEWNHDYTDQQYFRPCEDNVGSACPFALECAVLNTSGHRLHRPQRRARSCSVRPLAGFGWNPSLAPAPSWLVEATAGKVRFLATTRVPANNKQVRCANMHTDPNWNHRSDAASSGSDLLLLDAEYRTLERTLISGGNCAARADAVVDMRLLPVGGDEVLTSYNTFSMSGPACKGHWLSRLQLSVNASSAGNATSASLDLPREIPRQIHQLLRSAKVEPSTGVGGAGLGGKAGQRLAAERNAGVVVVDGVPKYELVHTVPRLQFHDVAGGVLERDAPASFPSSLHNSIHPLWVAEFGAYLGVAHLYTHPQGTPPHGGGRAPFQFGYGYRHVLYTLTPAPDLHLSRFSAEFCMPALGAPASRGGGRATDSETEGSCEGVQFVLSALRVPQGIALSYGVQASLTRPLTPQPHPSGLQRRSLAACLDRWLQRARLL